MAASPSHGVGQRLQSRVRAGVGHGPQLTSSTSEGHSKSPSASSRLPCWRSLIKITRRGMRPVFSLESATSSIAPTVSISACPRRVAPQVGTRRSRRTVTTAWRFAGSSVDDSSNPRTVFNVVSNEKTPSWSVGRASAIVPCGQGPRAVPEVASAHARACVNEHGDPPPRTVAEIHAHGLPEERPGEREREQPQGGRAEQEQKDVVEPGSAW